MTKVMRLVKRRDGVETASFRDQWAAAYRALAAAPGVRRCVLNLTRMGAYRAGEPAYDGIAELWFDDAAALETFTLSTEASTCWATEEGLADPARSIGWLVADDVVVFDGVVPDGGLKSIVIVHPSPVLDRAAFHRYWTDVHGPIGAKIPHLCRYVQSHARAAVAGPDGRPVEGCALTWFADTAAMRESSQSPEWAALQEDEPNFIDRDCAYVLVDEHVVVA